MQPRNRPPAHWAPIPLRSDQSIVTTLIVGVVVLATLAAMGGDTEGFPGDSGDLRNALVGMAFLVGIASAVASAWLLRALARPAGLRLREARAELDEHILPEELHVATLASATAAEIGGLFATVALFLTGDLWLLLIVAMTVAMLVKAFPSQGRLDVTLGSLRSR